MSIYSEGKVYSNVYILKSRVLGYMGEKFFYTPRTFGFSRPCYIWEGSSICGNLFE